MILRFESEGENQKLLWNLDLDNDIIQIPLAIVIIGSLAIAFLLVALTIILSNRTRGKNEKDIFSSKKQEYWYFVSI